MADPLRAASRRLRPIFAIAALRLQEAQQAAVSRGEGA